MLKANIKRLIPPILLLASLALNLGQAVEIGILCRVDKTSVAGTSPAGYTCTTRRRTTFSSCIRSAIPPPISAWSDELKKRGRICVRASLCSKPTAGHPRSFFSLRISSPTKGSSWYSP